MRGLSAFSFNALSRLRRGFHGIRTDSERAERTAGGTPPEAGETLAPIPICHTLIDR